MDPDFALCLARSAGIIRARDHRRRRAQLYSCVDRGELVILFPGVMVLPHLATDVETRIRAAAVWRPDAVVVGRAAARMTFWSDLPVQTIELAVPTRQDDRPGVHFQRRLVPSDWVWRWRRICVTKPALTTIDLIPDLQGAVISKALHARVAYDELWRAVSAVPHRRHQVSRRRMLRAYRDQPWSEAEQIAHVLFRSAHLSGWIANYPVQIAGKLRYLDIVFEAQRVVVEIDGYAFHAAGTEPRDTFESDRFVASTLTAHGWRVLRITWRQLTEQPEWVVACIRATLREADISAGQRAYRGRKAR